MLTSAIERLNKASDGEQVMTLNRFVFCATIAIYIWVVEGKQSLFAPLVLVIGMPITLGILGHLLIHPAAHKGRRVIALVCDLTIICLVIHEGDESTAVFFPLILWTICGNGFRFGLPGLWLSTALGIIGFGAVVITTHFWRNSLSLTVGLLIGLVILPAYVSILIKKLYRSRALAEAANEAKTEFLTNVSHELRTPLQAIIGANSLLADTKMSTEQADLSRTVNDAGTVLLTMIGGLLNFSAIERGTIQLDESGFNVVSLLTEVRKIAFATCQGKGLNVSINIGLSVPLFVKGDRNRIRDVLLNLIGNAIKFTEKGGLLVAVSAAEETAANSLLTFEVIDTGVGVSANIKERVFDKFFSTASAGTQRHGGLGLGLAICKKLVTAMGGDIGVQSGESGGSTFWFRVRLKHDTDGRFGQTMPRAAAVLFMPYKVSKGRLFRMLSEQGREILDSGSHGRPVSDFLKHTQGNPRVLLVRTPRSDLVYAGFAKLLKNANASSRSPIILVDEVGQTTSSRDLRWLAPIRLVGNFTDDDMARALEAADLFAFGAPETTSIVPESTTIKQVSSSGSLRVLIVDDNRTNRTIFAKMVESFGHQYSLASNGEEALIALEQNDFSLVLMDVNMPGIDGLQATKLRRLAELGLSRTPIIGMTADASPGVVERCQQAGMDDCVIKPINTKILQHMFTKFSSSSTQSGRSPGNVIAFESKRVEAIVDDALISSLESIGGREFVKEVLMDFGHDVGLLVDDLSRALSQTDTAAIQFIGHALASAAANIGAVRVRNIGLKLEGMSDVGLRVDGQNMVKLTKEAVDGFLATMEQRLS